MVFPIEEAIRTDPPSVVELGLPGLRHCLFKFHNPSTCYEMKPVAPYNRKDERKRLTRLYQHVDSQISTYPTESDTTFYTGGSESILIKVF